MSGYERHLQVGFFIHGMIISGGFAIALIWGTLFPALAIGTALPFTLVGSVAPDIDHHSSKAYVVVVRYVPVVVAAGVGIIIFHHRLWLVTLARMVPMTVAPAFLAGFLFALIVSAIWLGTARLIRILRPPHRTVTHRLSTWGVVALVGSSLLASGYASVGISDVIYIAGIQSGAFITGVIGHLYCDGLLKLPALPR